MSIQVVCGGFSPSNTDSAAVSICIVLHICGIYAESECTHHLYFGDTACWHHIPTYSA